MNNTAKYRLYSKCPTHNRPDYDAIECYERQHHKTVSYNIFDQYPVKPV